MLIAGPTASGKSALALAKARELGGVVVNTDALQVYDVLRILTARPSPDEMSGIPHLLYGMVSPAVRFSTGEWQRMAARVIADYGDTPLIFVGGTGLYFEALLRGFADVPDVPLDILREAEAEIEGLDREARGRLLAERDPETARVLKAPDPQRVARALAVLKATGRSLATYHSSAQRGLLEDHVVDRILINPDRELLRARIADRFRSMFVNGAVEEVRMLRSMELDPSLPAMKAIGVREISAWLDGAISRQEAIDLAITATHQYAKRQRTWFRGRMADWTVSDGVTGAT